MELIYEGVDIYPQIKLKQCIYDSYSEQKADTLKLVFSDIDKLWDSWKPKDGDRIEIRKDALKTGVMYVTSATREDVHQNKLCS